jgi:hypothetical protein
MDFRQIDNARRLLGLDEESTLDDIKKAYRNLSLKYHPDRCKEQEKKNCQEMLKKINHANDILMAYAMSYRCSFREKDVKRNVMDKDFYEHLKRFYDGWWGELDI